MYAGVNHVCHNETTPRYDKKAAELDWKWTVKSFNARLHGGTEPKASSVARGMLK